MAKKIYLSPSNQNSNTYATGGTNEMEQCNRIAAAAETALKRCGFTVKRAPKGQNMTVSINESNAWGADLHVPIHTNAGGGKGPEVFVYSTAAGNMKIATPVYNELAKASYSKTGRYIGTYRYGGTLAEIQNTKAVAVYCECEFHDNPAIAKWIISNVTTIGEAICKGICSGYGVKYVAATPAPTKTKYTVQIGAYNDKKLAEAQVKAAKAKGFTAFVKEQ